MMIYSGGGVVFDMNDGNLEDQCEFIFDLNIEVTEKQLRKYFEESYTRLDYYPPVILEVEFGDKESGKVLDLLEHKMDPSLN